jgi:hypothetical protein
MQSHHPQSEAVVTQFSCKTLVWRMYIRTMDPRIFWGFLLFTITPSTFRDFTFPSALSKIPIRLSPKNANKPSKAQVIIIFQISIFPKPTLSSAMPSFNPSNLPDLTGKVFIVTGGNAGMYVFAFLFLPFSFSPRYPQITHPLSEAIKLSSPSFSKTPLSTWEPAPPPKPHPPFPPSSPLSRPPQPQSSTPL